MGGDLIKYLFEDAFGEKAGYGVSGDSAFDVLHGNTMIYPDAYFRGLYQAVEILKKIYQYKHVSDQGAGDPRKVNGDWLPRKAIQPNHSPCDIKDGCEITSKTSALMCRE